MRHKLIYHCVFFVLFSTALDCTNGQITLGPTNAPVPPSPPDQLPTMNYAVIDVSDPNIPSTVDAVKVSDTFQFAYRYKDAQGHVAVNSGQLGAQTQKTATIIIDPPNTNVPTDPIYPGFPRTESLNFSSFTVDGITYATCAESIDCVDAGNYPWASYIRESFECKQSPKTELNLPDVHLYNTWESCVIAREGGPPSNYPSGVDLTGCAGGGYYGDIGVIYYDTDQHPLSYIPYPVDDPAYPNDARQVNFVVTFNPYKVTFFDPQTGFGVPQGSNIVTISTNYSPYAMNSAGRTIGTSSDIPKSTLLWNYPSSDGSYNPPANATPIYLGAGSPTALSDDDRVIFDESSLQGTRFIYNGKLWQNNTTTVFKSLIAGSSLRSYDSVGTVAISNEDPIDHSFFVVTSMSNAISHQLVLWKSVQPPTPSGGTQPNRQWQLYNMQLPAGTGVQAINSKGVVAAISNGGHALLLAPVQLYVQDVVTSARFPTIGFLPDTSMLQSPVFVVTAKAMSIPNLQMKLNIQQDIQSLRTITFEDDSSTTCQASNYLEDTETNDPSVTPPTTDAQGNITRTFTDAPQTQLSPSVRPFVTGVQMSATPHVFATVEFGNDTPQVVAEVQWTTQLSASFQKVTQFGSSHFSTRFLPQSVVNNPTPAFHSITYGGTPHDSTNLDPRTQQSNAYIKNPDNWKPSSISGKQANLYHYPLQ